MGKVYEFNPRTYGKSNVAHTAVILVPTEDRRVPRSLYNWNKVPCFKQDGGQRWAPKVVFHVHKCA